VLFRSPHCVMRHSVRAATSNRVFLQRSLSRMDGKRPSHYMGRPHAVSRICYNHPRASTADAILPLVRGCAANDVLAWGPPDRSKQKKWRLACGLSACLSPLRETRPVSESGIYIRAADLLTDDSAIFVSFSSAMYSSCRVCCKRCAISGWPTCSANVRAEPYAAIS
jgi:hypothetical protein